MATKKIDAPNEIYQIKVTLRGTTPPVWRRLLVPADMNLERLHDVLQVAIGWEDCHMHECRIGKQRLGSERTTRLFTVLRRKGCKAEYTYDFGDSWEHNIVAEKILAPEPDAAYPACTGRCLRVLQSARSPRDDPDDLRGWVDEDFDPEAFSIDDINRSLTRFQRRPAGQRPR